MNVHPCLQGIFLTFSDYVYLQIKQTHSLYGYNK